MEHKYKGYLMRAGAAPVHDNTEWKPIAQLNWTEKGIDRVKLWMEWCFVRSFSTCDDAEKEANSFAKSWIDAKAEGT